MELKQSGSFIARTLSYEVNNSTSLTDSAALARDMACCFCCASDTLFTRCIAKLLATCFIGNAMLTHALCVMCGECNPSTPCWHEASVLFSIDWALCPATSCRPEYSNFSTAATSPCESALHCIDALEVTCVQGRSLEDQLKAFS